MIEDKKRKTRRVSKKVKKMHEEAVAKGVLGSTAPEAKTGGGTNDVYKIDLRKGRDVVSSKIESSIGLAFINLRELLGKLEDNPGSHFRIEASDFFGRNTRVYRLEEL